MSSKNKLSPKKIVKCSVLSNVLLPLVIVHTKKQSVRHSDIDKRISFQDNEEVRFSGVILDET